MNIKLHKNGFIVQKKDYTRERYCGIEGDNWFINKYTDDLIDIEKKSIYVYYEEKIYTPSVEDGYIECCLDLKYIEDYVAICNHYGINHRILFVETDNPKPIFPDVTHEDIKGRLTFIGYDYAYPGGSYYSCINNDIVSKRISQLAEIELNENGLFTSLDNLLRFIKLRENLVSILPSSTFECGEFFIYRLWQYGFIGERV